MDVKLVNCQTKTLSTEYNYYHDLYDLTSVIPSVEKQIDIKLHKKIPEKILSPQVGLNPSHIACNLSHTTYQLRQKT